MAADPQQHPGSALKPRGFRGAAGFARSHVPRGSGAATSPSLVPWAGSANTGLLCLCLGWQSKAWAEISRPGRGSPLLAACSATTSVGSALGPPCCPGWGLCLSAAGCSPRLGPSSRPELPLLLLGKQFAPVSFAFYFIFISPDFCATRGSPQCRDKPLPPPLRAPLPSTVGSTRRRGSFPAEHRRRDLALL